MKYLILLFLFFVFWSSGHSQELVFEKEMEYSKKRETYPVYYPSSDTVALLIKDKKNVQLFILDSEMSMLNELFTGFDGVSFSKYLGGYTSGGNIYLSFLHDDQKRILVLTFNIKSNEIKSKLIDFNRSKERFVTSFSDTGRLVIITTTKRQSIINVYIFNDKDHFSYRKYDFSNYLFSSGSYKYTLDELLKPGKKSVKIANSIPVNVEDACKETKIYFQGKNVLISFDSFNMFTTLLELNVDDGSIRKLDFGQVTFLNNGMLHTNSFISGDFLYQFTTGKEEWALSKIDYMSETKRQTIKINKLNLESFINSEISFDRDNNDYFAYKEIVPKKVKNLYNKISRYEPFVFVVGESEDNLEFIIGGFIYQSQGGGMAPAPGGGGGMMMYGGGGTSFIAQCFSTVINSETFSLHPEGIKKSEIAPISNYVIDLKTVTIDDDEFLLYKNHLSAEKMFRYNDNYYLGYYLKEDKKYYIYRFENSTNE